LHFLWLQDLHDSKVLVSRNNDWVLDRWCPDAAELSWTTAGWCSLDQSDYFVRGYMVGFAD
jgi:hypothetical protein